MACGDYGGKELHVARGGYELYTILREVNKVPRSSPRVLSTLSHLRSCMKCLMTPGLHRGPWQGFPSMVENMAGKKQTNHCRP